MLEAKPKIAIYTDPTSEIHLAMALDLTRVIIELMASEPDVDATTLLRMIEALANSIDAHLTMFGETSRAISRAKLRTQP